LVASSVELRAGSRAASTAVPWVERTVVHSAEPLVVLKVA